MSYQLGDITVCETLADLPVVPNTIRQLYLDLETTAFSRTEGGDGAFFPHLGDRMFGIAIAFEDGPPWYIPIRHCGVDSSKNLPLQPVLDWLEKVLRSTQAWINHNVKFDAKFVIADIPALGDYQLTCALVDTKCLSQTIDSDLFNYSLKPLCRAWLNMDMAEEGELKSWLNKAKTKDYARLPVDLCARYAGMDVIGCRALWKYIAENRPEGMDELWETEIKLTSVLMDIELAGLTVDQLACKLAQRASLRKMLEAAELVHTLSGLEVGLSSEAYYEIIVNHLGMPVVAWTDSGNPSFDKEAMKLYAGHPQAVADTRTRDIISALQVSRTEEHFKSLFADSFLEKMTSVGTIHSNYNQTVRTGRMSCSEPNSQQFSPRAKRLIVPAAGNAFGCWDASQIEFRLIAHYCQIEEAIAAYRADKTTDYHAWVARLCDMTRKPAKTMNFLMAYGGGKKKAQLQLSYNEDVMAHVKEEVSARIAAGLDPKQAEQMYTTLITKRAEEVYTTYHSRLPEIKMTAERARRLCSQRGWIRNVMGRRRHLPMNYAHKAFNSLVQGCAMDIIKERMVAISPRFCDWTRNAGITIRANVHDEILFEGPKDVIFDENNRAEITRMLEATPAKINVPILWDGGVSANHWMEAKG